MDNASGPRQRSPWFYVLLGCGGLAGLLCLGGAVFVGLGIKQVKNLQEGVNDPQVRTKNAAEQLGAIPDGYIAVASMALPFNVLKMSLLSDQPLLPDGGASPGGRTFAYYRVMVTEQNKAARDFFLGKTQDDTALKQGGIQIDARAIIKRGELAVDGRKVFYVVSRGSLATPGGDGADALNNSFMFDCSEDALRIGIWSQSDPAPEKRPDELDLNGTVADEAQLAKLIKPVNPCGK